MNAFEAIVATILRLDGYWVHHSFHVSLTKGEKQRVGRPTMARPELDLVAYKAGPNELLVVECKSYLDSPGVKVAAFTDRRSRSFKRYKLFNDERLWEVVHGALVRQLLEHQACREDPTITLCLATGHIATENHRKDLRALFKERRWRLIDDVEIASKLSALSRTGYADDVAIIATKILASDDKRPAGG